MERTIYFAGDVSGGPKYLEWNGDGTASTGYTTLAALHAAGKVAFPPMTDEGIYAAALDLTALAAASDANGDEFRFATNRGDEAPPVAGTGMVVQSGLHYVESGFSPVSRKLFSNVVITEKKTQTDRIFVTAIYE